MNPIKDLVQKESFNLNTIKDIPNDPRINMESRTGTGIDAGMEYEHLPRFNSSQNVF